MRMFQRSLRVPTWVQVAVVLVLFGAAVGSLWRAGSAGFDRERRRAEVLDGLAEADDALAHSGVLALALVPEWPQTLDPREWDALDTWLAEASERTLKAFDGVEGGFYVPADDRYLGFASGDVVAVPDPKVPNRSRRRTSEPPPREYDLVASQVRRALDAEEPVSILADAPGGTMVAVRAGPVWVNARKVAATWTLTRLDDAHSLDQAIRGYRSAAGLAMGGIATALVLAAGLARTVRRQAREQVRMQVELRRSERLAALGKLLAGVAHEIRNPLAGIRSTAQLWQRGLTQEPEAVADVVAEVDRLETIVSRLLQFSKADVQDLRPGDLNLVVGEAARLARPHAEARGIAVELDLDPDLPTAAIDPHALLQVVRNLTSNALQAMPDGGLMRLATRFDPSAQVVEARVTDSGPGLSPEAREHLFEPFFTTRRDGTGLGLAIAREIALGHGGDLRAEESDGPPGAAFVLALPTLQAGIPAAKPLPLEELPV